MFYAFVPEATLAPWQQTCKCDEKKDFLRVCNQYQDTTILAEGVTDLEKCFYSVDLMVATEGDKWKLPETTYTCPAKCEPDKFIPAEQPKTDPATDTAATEPKTAGAFAGKITAVMVAITGFLYLF